MRVRERLEPLHLLRQVGKRGCHARLKLLRRLGVSALPNRMLASGNKKCLFGTEATLLDGGADLIPHFGGGVSKTSPNGCSIHRNVPSRLWRHSGTTICFS